MVFRGGAASRWVLRLRASWAGIDRGDPTATSNAALVQRLEQTLHIAVEYPLNHTTLAHRSAIYLTGYFYRLCLIAAPVILVWLYVSWPARYHYVLDILAGVAVVAIAIRLTRWTAHRSRPSGG